MYKYQKSDCKNGVVPYQCSIGVSYQKRIPKREYQTFCFLIFISVEEWRDITYLILFTAFWCLRISSFYLSSAINLIHLEKLYKKCYKIHNTWKLLLVLYRPSAYLLCHLEKSLGLKSSTCTSFQAEGPWKKDSEIFSKLYDISNDYLKFSDIWKKIWDRSSLNLRSKPILVPFCIEQPKYYVARV